MWELWIRIEPVAILYGGRGGRMHVTEHNSAARLLRELYRLGREDIPIRGALSGAGALDRSSIRALNAYLRHCYAAAPWRTRSLDGLHRLAWYKIQRECALVWSL